MAPQVKLVDDVAALGRKMRNPQHTFQVKHKPFQIVPFVIAPVLPGETLKNALLQSRVIGPGVKNPVLGAWCEHYVFYVKLRDLAMWSSLRDMLMDVANAAPNTAGASASFYRAANSVNYVQECLDAVVNEFFRPEGETSATGTLGDYPLAAIMNAGLLDSAIDQTTIGTPNPGEDYLPGENPENPDEHLSPEYDTHYAAWTKMVAMGVTDLDYDDYLKAYGIRKPQVEIVPEASKPELIRYSRDWKYPSNIVDASGNVASAWTWGIQERADKARFFKEPGFVFGVTVVRPKVYLSKQAGAGVGMLVNALQWLPKALETSEFTALKNYAAGAGPFQNTTNGYWVDPRDLFIYGDQMLNVALTATDAGLVALPTAAMQKRYVSQTDIDGLVKTTGTDLFYQDGVIKLGIAGRVREAT